MPNLTFSVTKAGLTVPVWIGLSGRQISTGRPLTPHVKARGLRDTGTDVTVVAAWVLRQLGVPLAATSSTNTASGQVSVNLFEVSLEITDPIHPGGPFLTVSDLPVMELPTVLPDTDVLIGLDVLLNCKLVLDGPAGEFSLEF